MPIILAFVLILFSTQSTFAQTFGIDSPLNGSVQSGTVAPPTGWTCSNGEVTASVDGGPTINFTENRNRGDTAAPCNNTGDNAFIIADPWNWNIFGDGQHTIVFFLNDAQFASRTFTIATFGTEFLSGSTASFTVQDFPDPGSSVQVEWDPAIQNFRITQVTVLNQTGIPNIAGNYDGSLNFLEEDCALFDFPSFLAPELAISQDGADITIVSDTVVFEGTVEENSDFTAIEIDPSISTVDSCTFATIAGYSWNFLDGLLVFTMFQDQVSGSCTLAGLPCTVSYGGTLTAKAGSEESSANLGALKATLQQMVKERLESQ